MKRKLAASIKGTPCITKFFKRSSEINQSAKPLKKFEASVILPKLSVKPISGSKGPPDNTTKDCKENITPFVESKNKQKEIDCSDENKQVSKPVDGINQDESVIGKLDNLNKGEKSTCEGILESDSKDKELGEDKTVSNCERVVELDNKKVESSVLAPKRKFKEEGKTVSTCEGIVESDNKEKELSVLAPRKKLKEEKKPVSICEGIQKSGQKEKDLSALSPKSKLKEENKTVSSFEGILESDSKDKELPVLSLEEDLKGEDKTVSNCEGVVELDNKKVESSVLAPKRKFKEEDKTVSNCEGIVESDNKEKELSVLAPTKKLKEEKKPVSICEGIQKSGQKDKDFSALSPKNKLKEENKTVSSFEGSLESGQKDEKLLALLPEEELTEENKTVSTGEGILESGEKEKGLLALSPEEELNAKNKTVSTCEGIQKSNYKENGLLVLASKEELKEEKKTISICEGIVEPGPKDENLLALSPEAELKEENKTVSTCEAIPESGHKEKELSILSPKEALEKENKTTLTFEKNLELHHKRDNITASSSKEGLQNEDKVISSCESNQELSSFATDNKVRGLGSPTKDIPSCDVKKTVNCASMSTSVNADMENMAEAEVSDSQMVIVENEKDKENDNEQKAVSVDNSSRDKDEEMPMTLSNIRSERHDTSSEEHGDGDEDIYTDEESDDELLSPPAFLCDYRVKPEVKTPEKCSVPLTGSPLTPISPFVQRPKDDSAKCRYSLAKLVLEKPKQVKKDLEMASLQNAIHEQIERGRMARLAGNYGAESEDDDDGDDAILPVHQRELDRLTSKDQEFTEEIPGENIFSGFIEPVKHKNGCSQPFPTFDATDMDVFTKSLFTRSDVEIRELLCGGWIVQRYLVHACPPAVVQWLFHILCYHLDNHTVQASYNALWSLFNAKLTKNKPSCLSWLPSVQDTLIVFSNYGANVTAQFFKTKEEVDNARAFLIPTFDQETFSVKSSRHGTPDKSLFPLVNINRVIQFLTLCVAKSPRHYSSKDLEIVAVLLWCLSLDVRLAICQHDIKTCLEAVYGALEPNHWPEESRKLSFVICQILTHHHNRLHLVQMQPYSSCRGRDIKRLAGLQVLASLAGSSMSDDEVRDIIRSDVDENDDKEVTDSVKSLEKLERLLHQVLINDDTNYYEVYTMVELLDLAVGAESLTPQEKVILERITGRLRLLHRDIKDPRAMFISRTKVKDLILRTISKFVFMAQGKKGAQRTISAFFEDAYSDLYIETLKETEKPDENIDLETESSFAASSEQGSLSPKSETSDELEFITKLTGELE